MSKGLINAGWVDAVHISPEAIERMKSGCEPHLLQSRMLGIPSLGSGSVYSVAEEDIVVDGFPIPDHYKKAYGMDVGWNATAAVWMAHDAETDTIYIYDEYKRGKVEPQIGRAHV